MFGEIDAALSLWDRFKSKLGREPVEAGCVAERFVQLFEAHGVHRNQVPRFFGLGLTLAHVSTGDALLQALTEEHLQAACELFDVRREWLDGASDCIHDIKHSFYKHPERFADFVAELQARSDAVEGMLFVSDVNSRGKAEEYDALLVLSEVIGHVGDKSIYRHYLCDQWIFSYWKCRADLAACMAIGWKNNLYIHGKKVNGDWLTPILEGQAVPNVDGVEEGRRWEAEDLALVPEVYLDGVSEGRFGKVNALERWLHWDAKGFMGTGFGEPKRAEFEAALKSLVWNVDVYDFS